MMRLIDLDRRRMAAVLTIRRNRLEPDFDALAVGGRFGLHQEEIVRLDRGSIARPPKWFDPRRNVGHVAIHPRTGSSVFMSLNVDWKRRGEAHPFDRIIVANAVRKAVQMRLI